MLALSAAGARLCEEAAVRAGETLAGLMDRAGAAVASEASALAPHGRVVFVTGPGNNGGDGWVAARLLTEAGRETHVLSLVAPSSLPEPARAAASGAIESGVPHSVAESAADLVLGLAEAGLVVDAVLGVGARGAPRPPLAEALEAIDDAEAPVLAVDMPSGVDAGTGSVAGAAVHADVTVTFTAPKAGAVLFPGAAYCGEVIVADIGIDCGAGEADALEIWEWPDLSFLMPVPLAEDDKHSRGRVLVVGGSSGLTGAAILAARGALRAGAGYVTVAAPEPSMPALECALTVPVKVALPTAADGGLGPEAAEIVLALAARADAVVLGPGIGRSPSTAATVRSLLERLAVPVVLDADALWALGSDTALVRSRRAATVLTPHAGEAARLLDITRDGVLADRPAAARMLASGGCIAVLKGARTLVSDGERVVVTMTGGPGLATLGTGDVLAGMTGTLMAQGLDALDAAALAAHLHGAAGDAASDVLTPVCCTAEDVLTYLPEAVRTLLGD
jgi:hydroxyethylthiazole kinase-like uncharacterized protein yjeF